MSKYGNLYNEINLDKPNKDRRFIYFPSLSCGNSKVWIQAGTDLGNGITSRFYDPSLKGTPWHFPYFLISAGHLLGAAETHDDFSLKGTITMGDSGGYQIASGAKKFDKGKLEQTFNWLENNSDIAMNLDIPPKMKYEGRFDESLKLSIENFKYFEQNQTGKTHFLNVLQGGNEAEYKKWYDAVKDFQFSGWGISNAHLMHRLMYLMAMFIEEKEFDKNNIKIIHILGVSSIEDMLLLSMLQQALNEKYDGRIQLTTDSSTPNRCTVYGTWYFEVNWKNASLISLYFSNQDTSHYNLDAKLPCRIGCPACEGKTFNDIYKYDSNTYMYMTNHNLYLYINAIDTINKIVDGHDEMIKEIFNRDYLQVYESIKEIFSSSHPLKTYEKYRQLYIRMGSKDKAVADKSKISQFFDI